MVARIIGHYPSRNRLMIDAGGFAITYNDCISGGWASVSGHPELTIDKISQEMGQLTTVDGSPVKYEDFPIGSCIELLPNHSCYNAAMFPELYLTTEDGDITGCWEPIRGW